MTETVMDPPPSPPPPDPRRLVRDPQDQVVAGVCAAFGRYTDTDPVLWRVAVAVLAVLGGAGIALYGFAWLLVPRAGQPESVAERALRRPDRSLRVVGVVGLALLALVLLALLDNGAAAAALVLLGGIGYLAARERRDPQPRTSSSYDAPPVPPVPPAPRERSPLGPATLSLAALVAGLLLVAREAGADGVSAARVLAAVLLVLGAGLLVGTWWGRARWLLPVGLVVAVAMAAASAADGDRFSGGVGERTWRAVDGGSYRLGVGEAVLDLRGLRGADDATVSASVGFGALTVLVPRETTVAVTVDIRLGELDAPGIGVDDGDRLHEELVVGPSGDPDVVLDLQVGLGEVEVRYA